jgi:methanogenic corrinoid protein MtbC1
MTTHGSDRRDGDHAQEEHADMPDSQSTARPSSDNEIARLSRSMLSRLNRTIETEIVPRFMLAFESDNSVRTEAADFRLSERTDEFVRLVLDHEADVAVQYVDALRTQGASLADIYLELLAPSARRLGAMWDTDDVTFTEVAIGVCRMHQVMLEFTRCFDPADGTEASGRTALIVPAPGEEHTFGLFLVVEFLRRAGWHCFTGSPSSVKELRTLVRSQHFDAVGLSLSAERHIEQTQETIAEIRRHSRNKKVAILLGGKIPNEKPELVSRLGADDTAVDGKAAVRVLNELCGVNNGASARG